MPISYDNKNYKDLAVSKSNFMPFLEQVDLKINRNVDHIFLKIEAKDLELDLPGLSNTRTFFDTVKLYNAVMSSSSENYSLHRIGNSRADVHFISFLFAIGL